MSAWTAEELAAIAVADELRIAPRRADGTLRRAVTIWVVRHGDDLYVRSARGRDGAWYRGTQVRHEGHVESGGVARDVRFTDEPDPALNEEIDREFRTKYRGYREEFVDPMVTAPARATTLKVLPAG
ncbi:MAG TPA: DUF2255 family protein [Actinophytocola sp.]|jgi:hypothetical protein|nr:DUF2255 family protein [Actinophytocola sp.]